MAKINLAEIEARAKKATAGPWEKCEGWEQTDPGYFIATEAGGIVFATDEEPTEFDAEFIAHAREDVPALITRLRRAEALLSEAWSVMDDVHLYDTELFEDIEKYFEEVD